MNGYFQYVSLPEGIIIFRAEEITTENVNIP